MRLIIRKDKIIGFFINKSNDLISDIYLIRKIKFADMSVEYAHLSIGYYKDNPTINSSLEDICEKIVFTYNQLNNYGIKFVLKFMISKIDGLTEYNKFVFFDIKDEILFNLTK